MTIIRSSLAEGTGAEPLCRDPEAVDTKEITESENGLTAVWQRQECILCQELARMDTELKNDIQSIS